MSVDSFLDNSILTQTSLGHLPSIKMKMAQEEVSALLIIIVDFEILIN